MIASLVLALAAVTAVGNQSDPCAAFDPAVSKQPAPVGSITSRDLVTIADIGRSDPYDSPSPFGVSPDGQSIAFMVRRANPDTDSYCQRLMVKPLKGGGSAWEIDRGGDFIRPLFSLRNLPAVRAGYGQVITPHWSPDGRTIAFLKREDGHTQVWAVTGRGTASPITHAVSDIEDFAWTPDGRGLVVATQPDLIAAEAAIDREARTGFLFDARFSPMMSDRPFPVGSFPIHYTRIDITTGDAREAAPAERALLDPDADSRRPAGAIAYAMSARGDVAWTEKRDPSLLLSTLRLRIRRKDGRQTLCASSHCAHIRHLWWSGEGQFLLFLTREGWRQSETVLYRWSANGGRLVKVLATEDALVGCDLVTAKLICAEEGSSTPRRLVAIDPHTGRPELIYDPNPQFRSLRLGAVRRLRYHNAYGVECYVDLVLPPDHKPGEKHPLVFVQYISEGFLRGGIGDEVPIQVLAAKGIAVLSFERPYDPPGTAGATSELDYRRRMRVKWIDRRSVESAIEMGVHAAVATGTVDPKEIGISGFSEGTAAVQWALINSDLFKVASLGVCCEDKIALPLNGGIGYEDYLREMGYPLFEKGEDSVWSKYSLAQNADRIHVPILVQASDDEYEAGLDVLQAFRQRGNPIEMYVFDHEPHFKWQPIHRLAMYDRVTDWFAFWLDHSIDCDPSKYDQYRRWESMRGAPVSWSSACRAGQPVQPRSRPGLGFAEGEKTIK